MKVLVIPEDFRNDQYILKPIIQRLFYEIGRPSARIEICRDPLLGGVTEALNSIRIREIVSRYEGMVDVFLLCVDRDGQGGRIDRLRQLEQEFGPHRFIAQEAHEELETWVLAGLDLPSEWRWQEVRADVSVKERYFDRLAKARGVHDGPGGGRKALGEEAARRFNTIRQRCAEDFHELARRIEALIA